MAVTTPRNFVLLEEYKVYSGGQGDLPFGSSLGLAELKADDHMTKVKMYFWNGNLMDHNTMGFFPFQVRCGDDYPQRPPEIRFTKGVNMKCVDGAKAKIPGLVQYKGPWNPQHEKPMSQMMHWLMTELQKALAGTKQADMERMLSQSWPGFQEII